MRLLPLLLLAGCPAPDDTGAPDTSTDSGGDSGPDTAPDPGCGDGVQDADEACDDGAANSDTEPDACRTDCLLPACGDGVVDAGEACDDGDTWGGDGCTPACAAEPGTLEVEPNDTWDTATPAGAVVEEGTAVHGALPAADVDCWSFEVPACGAVRVAQTGECGAAVALALHDPTGALLAVGSRGDDGCALLDPEEQPGARWIDPGTWSVCASGVNDAEVRGYTLSIETPDPGGLEAPAPGGDLDLDGVPDSCDLDVDGDGLDDADDNCPQVSNGPDTPEPTLSAEGYVRTWLSAGPFTTGVTTGTCRPSADLFVGEDAVITPAMGDPAGDGSTGVTWSAALLTSDLFDFLPSYGGVGAPREAYALTWLHSDTTRSVTLAVGADDGVFGWWNGELVLDVASCQGVNADQFQVDVDVAPGWNSLLLKVYDQGGGWGLRARFYEDGGIVTDLTPALLPEDGWRPDQTDSDGDGVGDVCEPG